MVRSGEEDAFEDTDVLGIGVEDEREDAPWC